ncbi:hypothetical protein Dda_9019 [Drechslerella dactyloides]|uniref:Uncharacterized protein n=1 Tax=Drechslerella dactyloides TaxID=74499 RepID=A0AAD6IPV2_DREDA|nr:hypothetical protein Dda_9019 [Drechslerella dactyloides]
MCVLHIGSFSNCQHRVQDLARCADGFPQQDSAARSSHVAARYCLVHGDCHTCKYGVEDVEEDLSAMWRCGMEMSASPALAGSAHPPKSLSWENGQRFAEVRKEWLEKSSGAVIQTRESGLSRVSTGQEEHAPARDPYSGGIELEKESARVGQLEPVELHWKGLDNKSARAAMCNMYS